MAIEIVVNNDKPLIKDALKIAPLAVKATKPVIKTPKPKTKTRTAKRALSAEIAEAGAALDRLYKAAQLIENTDAARWRRSLGVVFAAILQAADDAEAETATGEGETDE